MSDEYYFANQDDVKSTELCIFLEEYPVIKMGQEQFEKKTIPGRGNVWMRTGTFSDTEIAMLADVNTIGANVGRMQAYTAAREYLYGCKTISFCDSPDFFYKVKYVELDEVEQYTENAGDFNILMICEASVFLKDGNLEYEIADVLLNPYSVCHPIYRITGEGMCILTVNGNMMKANVGRNLTINTELMISYRTDGVMQNTSVTGEYDKLYLQPGENEISITPGFELKIVPNWRCL